MMNQNAVCFTDADRFAAAKVIIDDQKAQFQVARLEANKLRQAYESQVQTLRWREEDLALAEGARDDYKKQVEELTARLEDKDILLTAMAGGLQDGIDHDGNRGVLAQMMLVMLREVIKK